MTVSMYTTAVRVSLFIQKSRKNNAGTGTASHPMAFFGLASVSGIVALVFTKVCE